MRSAAVSYRNPVFRRAAAADPFVLDDRSAHGSYWAFTTGERFPILRSSDLVRWKRAGTAMRRRPSWVVPTGDWHPWAPSVIRVEGTGSTPDGTQTPRYVMYYTGLVATPGDAPGLTNCIGVASASKPDGPYADHGPLDLAELGNSRLPLGMGDADGWGNIDPAPFVDDDGRAYLYVSTDFDCTSGTRVLAPTISVIPLTADRSRAAGPRVPLLRGDQPWEQGPAAPTVEGPSVRKHEGTYYLLYSGGDWRSSYAMGVASGPSPMGPFAKHPGNPILSATTSVLGPGGGRTVVTGPRGGRWIVYHGRDQSNTNPRVLRIDPFSWRAAETPGQPDLPDISGPTSDPQPVVP